MSSDKKLRVTICGAGRTGHLAAILFSQNSAVEVTLYTSRLETVTSYKENGTQLQASMPDGNVIKAHTVRMTASVDDACSDADIIIITTPSHVRESVLQDITPAIPRNKQVFVGAIPGFGGFDWLAEKAFVGLSNIIIWGMKDVPHIAFDLVPGKSVRLGGGKSQLFVAVHRREKKENADILLGYLKQLYEAPVTLLSDYLEITLTPGNPIMHSSVIYGLIGPWGQWYRHPFNKIPYWWSDCPELGAYFLARCDEENQALCKAAEDLLGIDLSSVQPLHQEIVEAYGDSISDTRTLLSVLRTNKAYEGIHLPLIRKEQSDSYIFDKNHRVFQEDIACGLNLLVSLSERLRVPTPYMKEIYYWCCEYMGGEINPSPIPADFGQR
ncbi:NAD/NADP octopine/nopaline dehydrogenase family protein [Salmonella enterica]|nr:NAD/NADP octopine/nopaline dehydrogenase family protein [Salmonella enterica]